MPLSGLQSLYNVIIITILRSLLELINNVYDYIKDNDYVDILDLWLMECKANNVTGNGQYVMTKALSAEAKEINNHTYIVRITVLGFTHRPGQYVKIRSSSGLERYFSILSRSRSAFHNSPSIVELLVKFNEFLSASHRIILDILSGKEIFISQPCGQAYWRQSDYGNVLIACDSSYSYVRSIAEYIADNHSEQPTLLIWINETDHTCFDMPYINKLSQANTEFRFISLEEDYSRRNMSFINRMFQHIQKSHFSKSNFYIGSGNSFFQLLKDELGRHGVYKKKNNLR
ncbi:hypothetical protein [Xenorhabdus griffiniae]|uniref:hypothetical protein n=1 Tax=Xenorhabdus griffiniae TaxID=351672 RepID=UPI002358A065|nr:hypothetical protein [Xenorhabdus griffiniae]MDC9607145.1 hypothetical protein [Xenorhabdus griffiniae]